MPTVSIDAAIRRGNLLVTLPVRLLFVVPAVAAFLGRRLVHDSLRNYRFAIAIFALFCICFVAAWLWWSVAVPKWRLWAYDRVDDIAELKRRAVKAGLIWPDGSRFSRTEIKSAEHAERERELELSAPSAGSANNRSKRP